MDKIPVLIYTDIGRDVDDLEAITYIAGSPNLEPVAIVTTNMIPKKRGQIAKAVMNSLGYRNVPIGTGSIYPLNISDESLLEKYLKEHSLNGESYEGIGIDLDTGFVAENAEKVTLDTLEKYSTNLAIAILAPPTDIAKSIQKERNKFNKIKGIYVMGQAKIENGKLTPDESAYNLKEDMAGSDILFSLQNDVQFTFVTKFAAYPVPITRSDFETFSQTSHPIGKYLKTHAEKGIECFVKRAPEIFKKVFSVPADMDAQAGFTRLQTLSNPYDAITVMAIAKPELFSFESQGIHRTAGLSEDATGLKSIPEIKSDLMNNILYALRYPKK